MTASTIHSEGKIHFEDNKIEFNGHLEPQKVKFFSNSLSKVVKTKGCLDVILDFSNAPPPLFPRFVLPVIALCLKEKEENDVVFELKLPQDSKLSALFHNANWSYLLNPEKESKTTYDGDAHVPAIQFRNSDEQFEAVNRVMDALLRQLDNISRGDLKALEWSLNEITDNVLNHAESQCGGLIQASFMSQKQEVEFVVSDSGIGIPKSLNMPKDHKKALEKSVREGVTRDERSNQGNGLFGSFQVAVLSGGTFSIASGRTTLIAKKDGNIDFDNDGSNCFFPGTSVSAKINCQNPDVLQKALKFKGREHNPELGYIAQHFGSESGEYEFKMLSEISSFGSRESGRSARNKIANILKDNPKTLNIDFEGVGLISSSFADEVFGRLFVEMGPLGFLTKMRFVNVDEIVKGLIDRAITQRTRTGNGE